METSALFFAAEVITPNFQACSQFVSIRASDVARTTAQVPTTAAFKLCESLTRGTTDMGRMPSTVATFGPSLLVWLALGLITLFNSIHANLSQIRTEIVQLQEQRAEFETIAAVEAELGTPCPTPATVMPQTPSDDADYFAAR